MHIRDDGYESLPDFIERMDPQPRKPRKAKAPSWRDSIVHNEALGYLVCECSPCTFLAR